MTTHHPPKVESLAQIFGASLRLGLTAFGGPVAHLGNFRDEFVHRRRWLSEANYADLVALCQFLPGPASSQLGMTLGLLRRGYLGALFAWLGFTLPSAVVMIAFAYGITHHAQFLSNGLLHGLKIAAVAIVAQAVWQMGNSLCASRVRITLMAMAAGFALLLPTPMGQVAIIFASGLLGLLLFQAAALPSDTPALPFAISHRAGLLWLMVFFALLLGLPALAAWLPLPAIMLINGFFRAGALVFGGGHVVLPLLQSTVVDSGWISNGTFLAGYGAVQMVPGPLFTFAAFLGAAMKTAPSGWIGGLTPLITIFTPPFCWWLGCYLSGNARVSNSRLTGMRVVSVRIPPHREIPGNCASGWTEDPSAALFAEQRQFWDSCFCRCHAS